MNKHLLFQLLIRFAGPFLILFIPIFIGNRYALYRTKNKTELKEGPVGSVVGAAFGLLAFVLAFTFQIAANRFQERKELLIEEVTNIRSAYLRSGLIPEPYRTGTRNKLVDYVKIRIDLAENPGIVETAKAQSQQILDTLWKYSEKLSDIDRSSESYSLYFSSVNDLVNSFNQRVTMAFEYRIPAIVYWILTIVTILSMFSLGYQFGLSGRGSFWVNAILATVFALVIMLILMLDDPTLSKVNQKPMITLQQQLK